MPAKLKPLHDQIIVITGASSGIGLATAKEAARRGARVVLTGRNEPALSKAVGDIERSGGQAIHVVADVGEKKDLEKVAETAIARFGGIDTWVNNSGVGIFGPVDKVSDADHRRLFETNFWGLVYGSLIAARHLREKGGAIINIGSLASDVTLPNLTMYSASKHAVKGFTDGLRAEFEAEGAPISVTLIKPGSINTPFPQHARNYMAVEPKLPSPIYSVSEVALTICHAAEHPQRDVFIGGSARMGSALRQIAPRAVDKLTERMGLQQVSSRQPPQDPAGILEHPAGGGKEEGYMHGSPVRKTSLYTRAMRNPTLTGGLAVTVGLIAVAALLRPKPSVIR